jgi:hypothetical protein
MPTILALGGLKQEDLQVVLHREFKASLGYTARPWGKGK